MRTDKAFLRRQLLNKQYGDPWLKGFGLMMKGVEKYGVRIPFTPAGPFEIVWNVTSQCNRKCKHCYENAGGKRRGELSRKSGQNFLVEAHYASK